MISSAKQPNLRTKPRHARLAHSLATGDSTELASLPRHLGATCPNPQARDGSPDSYTRRLRTPLRRLSSGRVIIPHFISPAKGDARELLYSYPLFLNESKRRVEAAFSNQVAVDRLQVERLRLPQAQIGVLIIDICDHAL